MEGQCGETLEQCWWNSGTVKLEQCGETIGTVWWNSGTVMVKQWNGVGGIVEQ